MSAPDTPALIEALKDVLDPELGYNIVDLGLVYDVAVEAGQVTVTMSMTTPGCPAQHAIAQGVEQCLAGRPGVEGVEVNIVWEPRWTPQRMSDDAKSHFGVRS